MIRVILALASLPSADLASPVSGQTAGSLAVALVHGSPVEEEGRRQLLRTVRIHSRAIPHSHPVLTVNTRYLRMA